MLGLDLGITAPPPRLRPVAQIIAEFLRERYKGGVGPGFFDLFDFVAAGNRTYVNALGHTVTAGINAPRTGHHIYQDGQWLPVGLLLEPAGQNDLTHSQALDNAGSWSADSGAVIAASGTIGGLPAFEIEDENATGTAVVSFGGLAWTGVRTLTMKVDKNASPTSQFGFRVNWNDGASRFSGIMLNADTGTLKVQWGDGVLERGVIDQGDHWVAWVAYDSSSNTVTKLQIFPAHNNTNGVFGTQHTGKHRITAIQSEPGHIPGGSSYIKTEATPLARAKDSLEISAAVMQAAILAATGSSAMPDLTISMKGLVTYADTDQAEEVVFAEWTASSLNYIRAYLDTAGNNTGQAIFIQREATSGVDVAFSGPSAYGPGVNVPFSVASYHTAGSINGAHEGAVLTANLTPTALPDLTLAPIQIAPKGIITVKTLQMFLGVSGDDLLGELTQ